MRKKRILRIYTKIKQIAHKGRNSYMEYYNYEQLGEFTIVNRANTINYLGVTYSYYPDTIYYRNTDLYKKLDEPKAVILEVLIGSDPNGVKVYLDDPLMILLDKYKRGVDILISQNPSLNIYVDNNYSDDYFE